jgi:Spy/CpxP family protein refolding chaperone
MNIKKLVMTLLFTVIAVTVFAASTFAYDHDRGRGHGGGPHAGCEPAVLSQLGLNVEQTAKINAFRGAFLKGSKPLQDYILSKRADLKLLWLQQKPDEEKILSLQKEIGALKDQLRGKRDDYRLNVYNVLTPEQKEKLKSYGRGRGFRQDMRGNW